MLLNLNIVKMAARDLLKMAILGEVEDRDAHASLPEDHDGVDELADHLMEAENDAILYTMGLYIGAIGAAWGNSVGLVFHHMGLLDDDEQAADALYRLIASCWGHGIGLHDYYTDSFAKASEVLDKYRQKKMEATPTHFDQHESWTSEIVSEHLVYAEAE